MMIAKNDVVLILIFQEKYNLILDDEKYFLYGDDNYPGNDRYYTDDKDKCPENVRFKGEA